MLLADLPLQLLQSKHPMEMHINTQSKNKVALNSLTSSCSKLLTMLLLILNSKIALLKLRTSPKMITSLLFIKMELNNSLTVKFLFSPIILHRLKIWKPWFSK